MAKLILDRGNFADFTSISNVFLDEYMPKANGEFIKIYLHLLRLMNRNTSEASEDELTLSNIADRFNMLEADVNRALHYWADQSLLSLSTDKSGNIACIRFEALKSNRYLVSGISTENVSGAIEVSDISDVKPEILAAVSGDSTPIPVPETSGIIIPAKRKLLLFQMMTGLSSLHFWHRLIQDVHLILLTLTALFICQTDLSWILILLYT